MGRAGIETAQEYAWERRIDGLEEFYGRVAGARRMAVAGELAAMAAASGRYGLGAHTNAKKLRRNSPFGG